MTWGLWLLTGIKSRDLLVQCDGIGASACRQALEDRNYAQKANLFSMWGDAIKMDNHSGLFTSILRRFAIRL